MTAQCDCGQCVKAKRLVRFAEEVLGLEMAPWQRAVMLNLARCSREAVSPKGLEASCRAAKRRVAQTPPWARPVVVHKKGR